MDYFQVQTYTLTREVTAFGTTYPKGTKVGFRPLRVMQYHGALVLPDRALNYNRMTDSSIRKDINKIVEALDIPQHKAPVPEPEPEF